MTHHPDFANGIQKIDRGKRNRHLLIVGTAVAAIVVAALWLRPVQTPNEPSPPVSHGDPLSDEAVSVRPKPADETDKATVTVTVFDLFSVGISGAMHVFDESIDSQLPDEFVPTDEQELHDQKTRMFIAEAEESLPLIDIRPFNPIEAARRKYQAKVDAGINGQTDEAAIEEDEAAIEEQDNRSLKDGEVWIRVDPAHSAEHRTIMAQTADLYRVNTGFEGDVTVVLWVGGQPWARETYGPAW